MQPRIRGAVVGAFAGVSIYTMLLLVQRSQDVLGTTPVYWLNFVTHEVGHGLFYITNNALLIYFAGSLVEFSVPLVFAVGFLIQRRPLLAALMLLWAAYSFAHVSLYAGDAVRRELSLIGDDPDSHDWWNILLMLGWLRHTALISDLFWWCGMLCWLGGSFLGLSAAVWGSLSEFAPARLRPSPRR